ncbi:efflux RND transporter periplasmic adaptor subunit [Sagittula sp. NFXS13]
MSPRLRPALCAILLACASSATAQPMPGAGGPKEVGVVTLDEANVPFSVTLPGRAVASAQTDIRPRVSGMIEEIPYSPGSRVAVGDVLFRLEANTYETALAAAEAQVRGAEVAVQTAEATVSRYARLEGTGVTTGDVDTARSSLAQAQATLSAAKADLQSAQLDLERVEIRSPIDGIVAVSNVSVGAIVTANQTDALTTVTTMDPIYVDVAESSARITRVRSQFDNGTLQPGDRLDAALTLEDGRSYEDTGSLVTPGLVVSTSTGSVDMRFEFENPARMILPGQFLRVGINVGSRQAILVPQRASQRQADGTLTVFLAKDGVANEVSLTTSGTYQNAWIVTEGVVVGDQVIVDGLSNLSDGAKVSPVPVTINDTGVVQDVAPDDAQDAEQDQ